MITIRDVQSAEMAGAIAAKEMFEEWAAEFFTPVVIDQYRALMMQLTPEQHQQLMAADPQSYARVLEFIGAMPGGNK